MEIKIALAGNPNAGKTTLFNALTGSNQFVGNWPGVTVEKKEGRLKGHKDVIITDLPGIYSLSPYTLEEVVARNYLIGERPDAILNIIDGTNLERNLYLTTQLVELGIPVVCVINMMDVVRKNGDSINTEQLASELGCKVVEISALKNSGIKQLMSKATAMPRERKGGSVLSGALQKQIETACAYYEAEEVASPLFHAVKLLENDEIELTRKGASEARDKACGGEDLEAVIADERYKYISANLSAVKVKSHKEFLTKSDKIDRVLTHRVWAIPIFIVILFFVFHFTFSENLFFLNGFTESQHWMPTLEELGLCNAEGEPKNFGVEIAAIFYDGTLYSPGVMLTNFLNLFLDHISDGIITLMERGGAAEWSTGLVGDGILGGIFAVLGFLPQILTLFMFFSVLEDSGYMARIAFVLDRIFRRFGLSGRAFMPMIMGFGCSLPAMINTRTLADDKERTATIRVIPFFSCGAKLPILTAIAGGIVSFFGVSNADVITYGMYLLGICTAILCVLLMRNTTLKGETPPFIMELPAYHAPGFKNLMLHLWDKTKHFVKKAFTIIFASTVIIWLFSHLNWTWHYLPDEKMNESMLASLGMFIQPVFTPLGFGSQLGSFGWVFAVAALTGLVAKENVIATFGTLAACLIGMNVIGGDAGEFLADEEGISSAVAMIKATGISIPALIAFIAFNMTTIPCFAACATAKAELPKGKFKWTLLFWLAASFAVSAFIYTVGSWWWPLAIWVAVAAVIVTFIVLRNIGKFDIMKIFKRIKRKEK